MLRSLRITILCGVTAASAAVLPGYELHPEFEITYLAADAGGSFRTQAEDDLAASQGTRMGDRDSKNGGGEVAFRAGLSLSRNMGGRISLHAGTHLGAAAAEISGEATRGGSIREQKLELDYLLADWQIGAAYQLLPSLSAFADVSLEKGFFGSYEWIGYGNSTISEGDAGDAGAAGRIDLPWRTLVRLGVTWRLFGRADISPWLSLGPARLVSENSYLVDPASGRRLPMDDEASFLKGKAGLRLGYSM